MMTQKFTIEGRNNQLTSQPWLGQAEVQPAKEVTINLNIAGTTPAAAAAAVMAARMKTEDIPDYMDFISCPQPQPQMPALPEQASATSSSITKEDMMQMITTAIGAAMQPLMAASLEPMKLQQKQKLEADFTTAIAGKPAAEVVKLSKQLAAAEAKVDAATTATEIAAVKL
jgi:hypothetical protein